MDDLEIKIAITYKVPKINLTLNGLLRGQSLDQDTIMRSVAVDIFKVLEVQAREDYPWDRYIWNVSDLAERQRDTLLL